VSLIANRELSWRKLLNRWNAERVEDAMLRLARQCGIRAAESRVEQIGGKDVLLVKRFDRARRGQLYA